MSNALEQASLIMVPSGYEDGTLGSLKPTDGTGDFTFTRGSNISATRVDADGNIEKGYENLLYPSNDFSTWSNVNSNDTSGQAGYDGSNDATLLQASAVSGVNIYKNISQNGVYTFSVYAKSGTQDFVGLYSLGASTKRAVFDLNQGIFGSEISAIDSSMVSIGNGWYRCSVTFNASSNTQLRIYVFSSLTSSSVAVGDNIYIQDAMLNQGLVAYPYIETTTAPVAGGILEDMPRLDYSNGSCPSLLLEPERTNLVPYSEYFEGGTLSDATLSLSGTSPEGFTNSYALTENTSNVEHYWISEQMTTATSNNLVSTIFVKPNGRTKISLWNYHLANQMAKVDIDLTNNTTSNGGGTNVTFVSADVTDYTDGWKRVEIQSIKSSSTYPYRIRVNLLDDNGNDVYVGDGTSGVYIYGAQMEQDATYPTSYIPTYGVSQTRLAEDLDLNLSSVWDSTGNWTIFFEMERIQSNFNYDDIIVYSGSGTLRLRDRPNGEIMQVMINNIAPTSGVVAPIGERVKIVVKNDGNVMKWFGNGQEKQFIDNTILVNNITSISANRNHKKHKEVYFPTALSDDECIELTTIS